MPSHLHSLLEYHIHHSIVHTHSTHTLSLTLSIYGNAIRKQISDTITNYPKTQLRDSTAEGKGEVGTKQEVIVSTPQSFT